MVSLPARFAFAARLAVAAVVTLVVVLAVGERLIGGEVRRGFIKEQSQDYQAAARAIEDAVTAASAGKDRMHEAQDVVAFIARERSVVEVELVDGRGRVVAASDSDEIGEIEDGRVVDVARGAAGYSESDDDRENFEYVVPLNIGEKRFALEVEQNRDVLDARLAQFDHYMLVASAGALPLAVLLFFLLGGLGLTRRHAEALARSQRDSLTGLGNHSAFQEHATAEMALAERHREPLTLALVDIDDFKFCNDKLGHQYGDRVIKAVASALSGGRRSDRCFRLGGDEFGVVLSRTDLTGARASLEAASARLAADMPGVHLSIGLAVLSSADGELEVFREQADVAVYEAKRTPGTTIVAFDDISTVTALTHPAKVRALRELIEDGEMDVAFQPIWDLDADAILGYEALARPSAKYGFDGPGEAFELAEKIGSGHLLCDAARKSALSHAAELPPGALLFLNIAPKTLEHDVLAGNALVEAVAAAGLSLDQIVLEISEHTSPRLRKTVEEISRLRALGFKIALDDLGAGNAGFELLCSINADFVKIDGSVTRNALNDASARGVLEAIVAYARRTGAFVIAEGIEDPAQLDFLRDPFLGLDESKPPVAGGQGFLLGRPALGFETLPRVTAAAS